MIYANTHIELQHIDKILNQIKSLTDKNPKGFIAEINCHSITFWGIITDTYLSEEREGKLAIVKIKSPVKYDTGNGKPSNYLEINILSVKNIRIENDKSIIDLYNKSGLL
ncbi:hypothetical protein EHQ68_06775 [Leptospira congkakensis]|uniref:Uncharacterized protein n=1 Tax=Leptospira congkakensis TaxID=2484932 RepID=A0A4Z1ABM0_9LEPT|nr:hypothetical protein [Leptospira congkakensis]TGL87682.1 hypothetical protein EHQ69_16385 [Leptospira congkakensis]TGL89702.1 hypothetical protein EHQ68_06775 [Leptospira congkakensis]TGL95832.1 hypothetical protein EHQ70_12055 [Leptospira congkakensis]